MKITHKIGWMIGIKDTNWGLTINLDQCLSHNKCQLQLLRLCKTLVKKYYKRKRNNKKDNREWQKTYLVWISLRKSSCHRCGVQRNQPILYIYQWAREGELLWRRGKLLINLILIIIMCIVKLVMVKKILRNR